MLDIFLEKLKKVLNNRTVPLLAIFLVAFFILIQRSFKMQIASRGAENYENEETKNTQERDIASTRGNFYDRNGVKLSENVLSYSVVMSNTALVTRNEDMNAMVLQLINLLEDYGYPIELDFGIDLKEGASGEYSFAFNVEGNALLRFKKNAYCKPSIAKLSEEQKEASAEDVFNFLRYGDDENGRMFKISDDYSMEDAYKIMVVRYNLMILNPQWSQFTLASNIDDKTAAAVKENMADIPGIEVKQTTSRVYYDSKYFAHIIGYTGLINSSELESLNAELGEEVYKSTDVVGKTGMERSMESYLSGEKGVEQLTVASSNKILESKITKAPVAGNDVYLSVDHDLQIGLYHILERNIAAILISKINNGMSYGTKGEKASGIQIPIYEVYNALIYNNVIYIKAFKDEEASDLEKRILSYFEEKREIIFGKFRKLLAIDNTVTNQDAGEEMEEYLDYVYSTLISKDVGILVSTAIDRTDEVYLDYTNNKISLSQFLQYAISKNWVDLSKLGKGGAYFDNDEWYSMIVDYVLEYFKDDKEFEKKIYRTLIFTKKLTGTEICLLLFEQGVLEYNEDDIRNLRNGRVSAYNFMREKLTNLEITPGQLALEPCSGSAVITDVRTGELLAMVTYPSYDNNMLANKIDYTYYSKLLEDNARPLINRPTQQRTTTGSTFKPLMSFVGFGEGRINTTTKIQDRGVFEEIDPSPKCWKYPGSHGSINVTSAIQHSCNYFYYQIGYDLSLDSKGIYNDAKGIATIQKYAAMFGLSDYSGVEVYEDMPEISNRDVVRTAIGYYHNFAPVQIAKYITTVANSGICYDLTLLNRVMDKDGTLVYRNEPAVYNEITMFSPAQWQAVQLGMYNVVNTTTNSLNRLYGDLGVKVAGKTGTAQVSTTHPHNALFAAYAPYDDPEISVIIVIPNGYASANAAYIGREVMGLYFNGENKDALLSGEIKAGNATTIHISD